MRGVTTTAAIDVWKVGTTIQRFAHSSHDVYCICLASRGGDYLGGLCYHLSAMTFEITNDRVASTRSASALSLFFVRHAVGNLLVPNSGRDIECGSTPGKLKVGDIVTDGGIGGTIHGDGLFKTHYSMVPPTMNGRVKKTVAAGSYTIETAAVKVEKSGNSHLVCSAGWRAPT